MKTLLLLILILFGSCSKSFDEYAGGIEQSSAKQQPSTEDSKHFYYSATVQFGSCYVNLTIWTTTGGMIGHYATTVWNYQMTQTCGSQVITAFWQNEEDKMTSEQLEEKLREILPDDVIHELLKYNSYENTTIINHANCNI